MSAIVTDLPIVRIASQRDQALALMKRALQAASEAAAVARLAEETAVAASNGEVFGPNDRRGDNRLRDVAREVDVEATLEVFRQRVDASVWMHLLKVTGMEHLMDAKAQQDFFADLAGDVAPVTEDNIYATLDGFRADASLTFQRGLARAFSGLDRRFKSHDAFQIGSRIILTNVFDDWGSWSYYSQMRKTMLDIERILAILDGAVPQPGALEEAVKASRRGHYGPRQGCAETRYMRIRTFKNGNAHLWFQRDDLVLKANKLLAEFYGEVLPDAYEAADTAFKTKSGLPSKDLAFYPTPEAAAHAAYRQLSLPSGAIVLEPSAGTGHLVEVLLSDARIARVDAVEIHADRCRELRKKSTSGRLRVVEGNFLQHPLNPVYDGVFMNPPFYGTHWMEHVHKAFAALKPGGSLVCILPISAELGQSKKHLSFRKWACEATNASDFDCLVRDMPDESFAESGTRISTIVLCMSKPRY